MDNNEFELQDARYQVSSRREIIALLSAMMKDNLRLTMLLKDMDIENEVPTSILHMDEDAMFLKAAPDPDLNKAIVESGDIVFAANPHNALIKFSGKVQRTQVEHFLALKVSIPESLVRIQRREFFRIAVPAAASLRCKISFTGADGQFNIVWASVHNISAGGIGITDNSACMPLATDITYNDCKLELGVAVQVPVRLKVCSSRKEELQNERFLHHFGCEFVETPRAVLASIQRYILQLERELNAQKIKDTG
jgi:c-di-GMP-binding flagellar brake protein YcgR